MWTRWAALQHHVPPCPPGLANPAVQGRQDTLHGIMTGTMTAPTAHRMTGPGDFEPPGAGRGRRALAKTAGT